MKSPFLLLCLCAALNLQAAETQALPGATTTSTPPRRGPGQPALPSPEIHSDQRVTFRLRAPKASKVVVAGQWANGFPPSRW